MWNSLLYLIECSTGYNIQKHVLYSIYMHNSDGTMRTVSWFSEHRAAAASTLATTASPLEDMGRGGGSGAHVPVPGYVSVRPIEWALGRVPLDRLHVRVYHKSVELGATIAVCAAAVLCIILTLALLVFNVYYRKRKCVHISVHCTEHLPNHSLNIIMKSTLRCQYSTCALRRFSCEDSSNCRVRN